ncbi:MAG: carboxypeptidase regulatory-like domain-containing protein [Acidobacteria bacterium]|nr:carboxypeptidase regulatory-like domain-containing protein [Acidobacteriota bacterium]
MTSAEIRLPPECAIRGRVLDEGGDAVDSAWVVVYRQFWRYGGKRWDRVNGLAETNDAGEYRVAGPATPHRFTATGEGRLDMVCVQASDRVMIERLSD